MGLIEFFGLVFILKVIKSSYLLVKKLTLLVNQGAQKAEVNFLRWMFGTDMALKVFIEVVSDC